MRWRRRGGKIATSKRAPDLFVYGTLRRGFRNKFARLLHANADFLGTATLQARLTGTRPHRRAALSNKPSDQLPGEVFRLHEPAKLFPMLDEYEGPEYKRTLVRPKLDSGRFLQAWVYLYKG